MKESPKVDACKSNVKATREIRNDDQPIEKRIETIENLEKIHGAYEKLAGLTSEKKSITLYDGMILSILNESMRHVLKAMRKVKK